MPPALLPPRPMLCAARDHDSLGLFISPHRLASGRRGAVPRPCRGAADFRCPLAGPASLLLADNSQVWASVGFRQTARPVVPSSGRQPASSRFFIPHPSRSLRSFARRMFPVHLSSHRSRACSRRCSPAHSFRSQSAIGRQVAFSAKQVPRWQSPALNVSAGPQPGRVTSGSAAGSSSGSRLVIMSIILLTRCVNITLCHLAPVMEGTDALLRHPESLEDDLRTT